MRLRIPGGPRLDGVTSKRGKVKGFSRKSRDRLLDKLNQIDQKRVKAGQVVFVTLTYPRRFPTPSEAKRDLGSFSKRMRREFGPLATVWKMEPQKRGAPHFHLLVMLPSQSMYPRLQAWVPMAWHDIAGQGDAYHLAFHRGELAGSRPCVEQVQSWESIISYAGKYLAKVCEGDEGWAWPGRFWGIWSPELLAVVVDERKLPEGRAAILLKRVMVRYFEHQASGWWYVPGKRLADGRDLPGCKLWGGGQIDLGSLRGPERVKDCIEELEMMYERKFRQQRRRWRGSRGGIRLYVSELTANRMIAWAFKAAGIT